MRLTLHFFGKDLRRLRLLLAFWLVLIAVQYGVMAAALRPGDHVAQVVGGLYSEIGTTIQLLVLATLVGLLVQEEPPAGTTGFWLTRPMPKPAVLAAKGLFALILVVVPIAAETAVLAAAEVTRHDILLAVPQVILAQLQVILAAGVIAALTSNFTRFAIAGAVTVVALQLVNLGMSWLPGHLSEGMQRNFADVARSRMIAREVLLAIGLAAVLAYQYLSRRTVRALVGAAAIELAAISLSVLPLDFFPPGPKPPATIRLDADSLRVTLLQTNVQDRPDYRGSAPPKKNLAGTLRFAGIPEGYVALPEATHPRLRLPDGGEIAAREPVGSYFIYEPDATILDAALGRSYVYGYMGQRNEVPSGLALIDPQVYQRYAQQPLRFSANFDFEVDRYAVAARMPLAKGASVAHGSEHEFITDVLHEGGGISIQLNRRTTDLLFGRTRPGPSEKFLTSFMSVLGNRFYLLYNRRNFEVLEMSSYNWLNQPQGMGQLRVENWVLSFGTNASGYMTPDLDAGWLADAELVELELVPAAEFRLPLTVDNFVLAGPNISREPAPPPAPMDPIWLTRFSLPEHPTKGQMAAYAYDVVVAAQYWRDPVNSEALPVEMLAKVGPGNADVLLKTLDRVRPASFQAWELVLAAVRAAGPADKAAVLRALAANPELADLVVKYQWQQDCRGVLLAKLNDPTQKDLPRNWIVATAALEDPSTYPALKGYLLRARNRQMTYNVIRKLPGIDLRSTVDSAWAQARNGTQAERVDAAAIAIDLGRADALELLVNILRQNDMSRPRDLTRATNLVLRYTPAKGDTAALVAWYDAHRGSLVYNPRRHKFLPRS